MKISKTLFGKTPDGKEVFQFTLTNKNGVIVKLINYGATVSSIEVPDKNGLVEEISLGYDNLEGYINDGAYLGTTVGRYANRIAKGKFTLDGKAYVLALNENGINNIHGGNSGFNKKVWKPTIMEDKNTVSFSYLSKDMEEGFPGNVKVKMFYTLTDDNELKIKYQAKTDKTTHINFTNHSYFNLNAGKSNILEHDVQVHSGFVTEVNELSVPTGKIIPVDETVLDLRERTKISSCMNSLEKGFDNNYVLSESEGDFPLVGEIWEETSGRKVEVYTTEPGMQLYTGYYLDNINGKNGKVYKQYDALCMEAQHYPDSPNHSNFPTTVLRPEDSYSQVTVYKFLW